MSYLKNAPGALAVVFISYAAIAGGAPSTAAPDANASSGSLTTYTNPFGFSIADPFVLQDGDTYYMYGTTDAVVGRGFDVYKSTNLADWTRAAKCYAPTDDSWGGYNFWAPEVVKKDGYYYMHYTVYSSKEARRNILVARSESPEGPFIDYAGPLFPDNSIIDSHIYHDTKSGDYFIYASPEREPPSRILGAKISPDFKQLMTSPTECLAAEFGWEDLWIEGPIIHERNGTLYMLYSGGAWWESEYSLGCATAQSPLGPWTKYESNPVLKNNETVDGPGHNGLAWSPDGTELFLVYHTHAADWTARRVAALDRILFEKAESGPDVLTIPGAPSSAPQPLPSGAAPRQIAKSDDFDGDNVDLSQWHIYSNYPDNWKQARGALHISAVDGDFWRSHDDGQNLFLQLMPTGDFDIETSLTMDATRENEQAFLTIWGDEDNHIIFSSVHLNGPRFAVTREKKGKADTALSNNEFGQQVCLRIEKRGETLQFFASEDGNTWKSVGRESSLKNLHPKYVGVGAWSPGNDRKTTARFDWFRVK